MIAMKQMCCVGRMQSFQCEMRQYIGQLLSVTGSITTHFMNVMSCNFPQWKTSVEFAYTWSHLYTTVITNWVTTAFFLKLLRSPNPIPLFHISEYKTCQLTYFKYNSDASNLCTSQAIWRGLCEDKESVFVEHLHDLSNVPKADLFFSAVTIHKQFIW